MSHAGSVEIEVKLRVASPEAASSLLVRSGARRVEARHFEDNRLFDDAAGSLRARGVSLRLRRTPLRATLTYKGPRRLRDGLKAREERETNIEDADEMQAILLALGLSPVFRYQKYREVWALGEAEVVVDETPMGSFLEIEGEAAAIHGVASRLGFSPREYVAESYPALFLAAGGSGDMLFP